MSKTNTENVVRFDDPTQFRLSGVTLERVVDDGEALLELRMPSTSYQDPRKEELTDRDFMAWVPLDFGDGTIDVEIKSNLATDAPTYARGFVGIAFRIDPHSRFESIYLRPTNSVADDQVRRNHTVQYAAYPDFRFATLRRDFAERYETYADIDTGRWIHMRIVVRGVRAELYLDHRTKPAFIVSDLKFGTTQNGGVGIWIESGTVARFRQFTVTGRTDTSQ